LKVQNIYINPCFEIAFLGENVMNFHKPKVDHKCHQFFGLPHLYKNHNELQESAHFAKKLPNLATLTLSC
jgi:hypothetical protein